MTSVRLVLASGSPRRAEILRNLGVHFDVAPSPEAEPTAEGSPTEAVLGLAEFKARQVARLHPDAVVIGADTVIDLDGAILGKPRGEADALQMLRLLNGRTHLVWTGVAVLAPDGRLASGVESSKVHFTQLPDEVLLQYVRSGEPLDKAGSYGIQGRGALLVAQVEGSYHNVVGLPVQLLEQLMKRIGMSLWEFQRFT